MKLTTAAYFRPSGKNIHHFPDAKDQDEWGVLPDKGFELKLNDEEMVELHKNRRDRDILRNGNADKAAADKILPAAKKEKPFVDRQLQMAIKYLTEELAKQKEDAR